MKRIIILSDTHGMVHPSVEEHLGWADEVWHAGDLGPPETLRWFQARCKVFRAVSGNADPNDTLHLLDKTAVFGIEGVKVVMHHIVGKPGRYVPDFKIIYNQLQPDWVVCGHSHILMVAPLERPGKPLGLHINPGSAGQHGFHNICTLLKFEVDNQRITKADVVELGPRGRMFTQNPEGLA